MILDFPDKEIWEINFCCLFKKVNKPKEGERNNKNKSIKWYRKKRHKTKIINKPKVVLCKDNSDKIKSRGEGKEERREEGKEEKKRV